MARRKEIRKPCGHIIGAVKGNRMLNVTRDSQHRKEEEEIMTKVCVVCKKPIGPDNWDKTKRIHKKMLRQADEHDVRSLTENQQVLYMDKVHVECFDQL